MNQDTPSPVSPTHAAALEYAGYGWHVFPIEPPEPGNPKSGKRPLTDVQLGLVNGKDDATTDPRRIAEIWARYPNANVGIACEPSRLVVLDVDVGTYVDEATGETLQKQGKASLAEIEAELPPTLTALTGNAGLHAIYRADDGPAIQRLAFKPGLDLIGKGYIVAAPSVHWTGKTYRWSKVVPPAPLPPILRKLAGTRVEKVQPTEDPGRSMIRPGERNVALFRLGASLRDTGIGKEALAHALHTENQQRCTPPLADEELRLIIESVWKRVVPRRDVAAGAIVQQEIAALYKPPERAKWVSEIAQERLPPQRFYRTGFEHLDALLGGGLASRHQCGVIGPPSTGKSGFVNRLAKEIQKQIPVLLVSAELPAHEVMIRFACEELNIPWRDGLKGLVPYDLIERAVADLRIRVIGSDTIDRDDPIGMIRHEAGQMREQAGIAPAIFEDYVQLLARGAGNETRSKVGELSMAFRVLSQDFDTPVVTVYSSRRDFYSGAAVDKLRDANDPTAYLVAAKESGDIEFDCATLLYLDIDKLAEGLPKPGRVVVARCRSGEVGFVGVRADLATGRWNGDQSAVSELSQEQKRMDRRQNATEAAAQRLLELIQRMPGRPWRELRAAGGGKRADEARAYLLERGIIELVRETGYDAMHRKYTTESYRVVKHEPPAPPRIVREVMAGNNPPPPNVGPA